MSDTLRIKNLGQIEDANIEFKDLTVFVGPQATGKSIVLQLLKLLVDTGRIQENLERHGIDWSKKVAEFFDVYFGEGMRALWSADSSSITWKDRQVDMSGLVGRKRKAKEESLFYVPAQRVMTFRDGWPRAFMDYSAGDPYVVREFSEAIRLLMELEGKTNEIFPQSNLLKSEFRDLLEKNVFAGFSLGVDKIRSQKRLILNQAGGQGGLPFMVWSAGQREFVPLLLSFYKLMPPAKVPRRGSIEWVVLEELEMGLHPRALTVVTLLAFELLHRGYRVCLSTHSPQMLDTLWALRHLQEQKASPNDLLEIFQVKPTGPMTSLAKSLLEKKVKVYYFDPLKKSAVDISELDPDSEDLRQSGWGGLTEFSGRANEAVAKAVANSSWGDKR